MYQHQEFEKQNKKMLPYLQETKEIICAQFETYREFLANKAAEQSYNYIMSVPVPKPNDIKISSKEDDTKDLTDLMYSLTLGLITVRYGVRIQFDKYSKDIGVRCWLGTGNETQYHKWKRLQDHNNFKIRIEFLGWVKTGNPNLIDWVIYDPISFRDKGYLDLCYERWIKKELYHTGGKKKWFEFRNSQRPWENSGGGFVGIDEIEGCILCEPIKQEKIKVSYQSDLLF